MKPIRGKVSWWGYIVIVSIILRWIIRVYVDELRRVCCNLRVRWRF